LKTRSFKKIKKIKRIRNSKFKSYSFAILSDLVDYDTSTYTEQNLNFNLQNLLLNNTTFQTIMKSFQSYKITSVNFRGIPRTVGGTQPKPVYIFLDVTNNLNFSYTQLPRLQGSKCLSGCRVQTFNFKSSGRQDDFSYWFDSTEGPHASIRLRSIAAPNASTFWQFQLKFYIKCRGMRIELEEQKQVEPENVVQLNNTILDNENSELNLQNLEMPGVVKENPYNQGLGAPFVPLDIPPKENKVDLCKVYQKFKPIEIKKIENQDVEKDELNNISENDIAYTNCKNYYDNVKLYGVDSAKQMLEVTRNIEGENKDDSEGCKNNRRLEHHKYNKIAKEIIKESLENQNLKQENPELHQHIQDFVGMLKPSPSSGKKKKKKRK
jgi:hypothetical protein